MIKKVFFFYLLLNLFNNCIPEEHFKIIVNINNYSVTKIDLENEIKIISILNKNKLPNQTKITALNNLIEETIKNIEIKKENLKIEENLISQYFLIMLKNLDLDEKKIEKKIIKLIKKKIKTDMLWKDLIMSKYGWKININMNEIEKKIKEKYKENDYSIEIKEKLILEEKNKKLIVFSKFHLNKLKRKTLITFTQ